MRRFLFLAVLWPMLASAGAKSNAWSSLLVNKVFQGDATVLPGSLTVRLYSVCPTATTGGTELVGNGYTPAAVASNGTNWTAAADGVTSNATPIGLGTATANWSVACFALESGGMIYYFGPSSVTVLSGETASFPPGGIVIAEQDPAETPTFTPGAGTYSSTQSVTIASATPGAALCYTADGTTPAGSAGTCSAGSTYVSPVSVATSETLKAVATKAGYLTSAAGSAAYTINTALVLDGTCAASLGDSAGAPTCSITTTGPTTLLAWLGANADPGTTSLATPGVTWTQMDSRYDSNNQTFTALFKGTAASALSGATTTPTYGTPPNYVPRTLNVVAIQNVGTVSGVTRAFTTYEDKLHPQIGVPAVNAGSWVLAGGLWNGGALTATPVYDAGTESVSHAAETVTYGGYAEVVRNTTAVTPGEPYLLGMTRSDSTGHYWDWMGVEVTAATVTPSFFAGVTRPLTDAVGFPASADQVSVVQATPLASGSCTRLTGYWTTAWTSPSAMRAVLYADNAGAPGALLGVSDPITTHTANSWVAFPLQSAVSVTAGTVYWIGIQSNLAASTQGQNAGSNVGKYHTDAYADGPQNPWVVGDDATSTDTKPIYLTCQ